MLTYGKLKGEVSELKKTCLKQQKDLIEAVNRIKELKNSISTVRSTMAQQRQIIKSQIEQLAQMAEQHDKIAQTILDQIEQTIKSTLQHVVTEDRTFYTKSYINEDY